MSQYAVYKKADEFGISHATASFIWSYCETPEEYEQALEDYANGYGFSIID